MAVGKSNPRFDVRFGALPEGKRVSASGHVYYETRRNRSDFSKRKKL